MRGTQEQIMEQAIGWAIRLHRADLRDWEDFTDWLEADPAHLAAYEEVGLADLRAAEQLGRHRSAPTPAPLRRAARPVGRRMLLAGGAAAALAASVGYFMLAGPQPLQAIETAPGERRTISLAGATSITLNGGSKILLDRGNVRFARLERGEALFSVVHEPSNPFRVEAGDVLIRNVGTVFNVLNQGDTIEAEVAQGAILFSADGEDLSLSAGDTAKAEAGAVETGRRDPTTVGGWRDGQLSYSSASFAQIARDLTRNSGIAVRARPEVAERRFSGVILLDPNRDRLRRRVSALLEVDVRLAGEGWILAPSDR